jgi:translocation and assembly module TamB
MAVVLHNRDAAAVIWMKYLLRGTLVVLVAIVAAWFWLLHTQPGASWVWRQLESAMDGELTGELTRGDFVNGIEIENLRVSTSAVDLSLDSNRASIDLDLFPLRIEVTDVHLQGVTIRIRNSESESEGVPDVESLLIGLQLPLQLDLVDVRVDDIELLIDEGESLSIERIDASVIWHDKITIRQFQMVNSDDSLMALGSVDLVRSQSVDLTFDATYQAIAVHGDVSGDAHSVELRDLVIEGDAIEASASAIVHWVDGIRSNGKVAVKRFDPATITEVWPNSKPISGIFNVEASTEFVRLSESIFAIENSDAVVQLDAQFDGATSTVSAEIAWLNLQWPIDSATPTVRSADGKVSIDGVVDDWHIEGIVAVGTEEMPDGRFQIDGGGDQGQVALNIREGEILGGILTGEAEYSWRDEQAWSANVEFEELRTTSLAPDWPGVVSGKAEASGTQEPMAIHVTLRDVDGVIRGDALAAAGSLAWSGDLVIADNLSVAHGDSELFLNGSADTAEGLTFRAGVDIGPYVNDVSGTFEAAGRLSRIEDNPFVSIDLTSSGFQVGDVRISGVRLIDDRADDALAGFTLQVDGLQLQGQNIADIQLIASIRKEQQSFELTGINRDAQVGLALSGAFDDWSSASESTWRGTVSSFSVDLEDEHRLRLEKPAAVELSSTKFAISEFCLADDVASHLCVDALRKSDGRIDLLAELSSVPVALIEHLVDTDASFDQHISGSVSWSGDPDSGATGKGELELSSGAITSIKQPSLSVRTGTGRLSFEITDGDFLSGTASIPMPGVGGIEANFKVLELSEVVTSDITGHLSLEMTDIASLALLSNLVDSASGDLHADLDLAGTFLNPLLTGSATLDDGALSYRPVGLKIDQINLQGELTENRAIEIEGRFRIGDGHGEIISSADYRDRERPGLRFKIRGEALQLVDVPDIQLSADPDIEIAYGDNTLNINGSLLISKARITPSNFAETRVTESDDIVIVAGRLPESREAPKEKSDLQFDGNLRVDIGNDVDVILNIAKAKLSGGAAFDWQGSSMPIVDGRFDMTGSINAFGQVLDIAEGSIRFDKVPANQPYLRIRAEREIFGNSQVKRAGILVSGVASRPNIDPYTYPVTTEERALTLLVTGSDFDYEQGLGAVDFGTYIAPRLFVSYGVSIFDQDNVISARYDLAKGFGVKASSGDKASGVDLNYRFEN